MTLAHEWDLLWDDIYFHFDPELLNVNIPMPENVRAAADRWWCEINPPTEKEKKELVATVRKWKKSLTDQE